MKHCPNCGAAVGETDRFCAECGRKLEAGPPVELPKEPVYTDDPALLNDPVLNSTPAPAPKPDTEKVPELTLEPDLWGLGSAAAAAQPAKPAEPAEAPHAAAAAQAAKPAEQREAPNYADYMREAQKEAEKRKAEERYDNVPNDYTMSRPTEPVGSMPDETLMLIWSIVLTVLCNIPGIVGLVMTLKARSLPLALKAKKLNTAKIWLIVGTVLYALGFIGNLF